MSNPGCELCGAAASLRCSKCLTTYYCCKEHQRSDWKDHKKFCFDAKQFKDEKTICAKVKPSSQECFMLVSGVIKSTKSRYGGDEDQVGLVDVRVPITADQLVRFTDSPSHACRFVEEILTLPNHPFMLGLRPIIQEKRILCCNPDCEKRADRAQLDPACFAMNPPIGQTTNEFHAFIMQQPGVHRRGERSQPGAGGQEQSQSGGQNDAGHDPGGTRHAVPEYVREFLSQGVLF